MDDSNAIKALRWIINILDSNNIPYQIEGGLAANCYGSTRELADIDIFIPNYGFAKIFEYVKQYVQFGPGYYEDDHWKLIYQILNYNGQQIELCDADNAEFFDTKNNKWIKKHINFDKVETILIFGIKIKVIPKIDLIDYKRKLSRDVDIIDIEQLNKPV